MGRIFGLPFIFFFFALPGFRIRVLQQYAQLISQSFLLTCLPALDQVPQIFFPYSRKHIPDCYFTIFRLLFYHSNLDVSADDIRHLCQQQCFLIKVTVACFQ